MSARIFVVGLIFLGFLAVPALAQQVTGRVTHNETLRPLAGAQVSIPGSRLGALANAEGRFVIVNVPVGTHSVVAQIIGYGTQERSVTVTAGQIVTVDFQLQTEALGLDEIVVTGTVGNIQRRAVGNVVGTLNTAAQLESTAPASVQQILSGQVPGVSVQIGTGVVGSGGGVMIRGASTLSLNQQPLLYIDGVRANGGFGSWGSSRLNDINAEDIERIEVIKGPAAATLYGTEASNGVIQIITKKGIPGRATVELMVQQGGNWFNDPAGRLPTNYGIAPDGQTIISQHLFLDEEAAGRKMFRTGREQSYSLNVRGGEGNLTYYFSAGHNDGEGILRNNDRTRTTARTNIQAAISDQLDMSVDMGLIRSLTHSPRRAYGIFGNYWWGSPSVKDTPTRGFQAAPPEISELIDQQERVNRATLSFTSNHRPTDWLSQRFVWGLDWTDSRASDYYPRLPAGSPAFFGALSAGAKRLDNIRDVHQTFDYNVTLSLEPTSNITAATSFGVQYFVRERQASNSDGIQMPTSAVSTVSSAAVRTGGENYLQNKTFGFFVQETMGWRNQAFLTAALRADGNSAFGESFDAAYYPKLSGTWVVSDAGFWDVGLVESLRLRAAWGKSGMQPDVFAAVRTYSPSTGPGDQPTVRPGAVGNPDLKPEVGSELELGFDAGLFQDRVNVELTYYRQTTKDAIMSAGSAPSSGFDSNRFINIGEVRNEGYEIGLQTYPIRSQSVNLSLSGTVAYNKNKLVDDGDLPHLQFDRRERFQHVEGYPLGGNWSQYVASAEWAGADGRSLKNVMCHGGPPGQSGHINLPKSEIGKYPAVPCKDGAWFYYGSPGPGWSGSLVPTLRLGNLTLNALFVFTKDRIRYNTSQWKRDANFNNSLEGAKKVLGQIDPIKAASIGEIFVEWPWFQREDYIRLRDLSLNYSMPSSWVEGFGVSRATLTLTGRNLWTKVHSSFTDLDPESREQRDEVWGWHQVTDPVPHSLVTTLRVMF